MKCINCGQEIDEAAQVCPHCGQSVRPETERAPETDSAPEAVSPQPEKPRKKKKRPVIRISTAPVAAGVALCLLGLVLTVSGQLSAGRRIREMDDEYAARMQAQAERYEARLEELEAELTELREHGVTAGAKGQASVRHYPTNEVQSVGSNDRVLFLFEVDGSVEKFTWEKRGSDGSWSELTFAADNTNTQYGLYLDEDLAIGVTRLCAAHLKTAAAGAYRCTAETRNGEAVAEATLSVLQEVNQPVVVAVPEETPAAEATAAPEAAPAAEPAAPVPTAAPDDVVIISDAPAAETPAPAAETPAPAAEEPAAPAAEAPAEPAAPAEGAGDAG